MENIFHFKPPFAAKKPNNKIIFSNLPDRSKSVTAGDPLIEGTPAENRDQIIQIADERFEL